MTGAYVLSSELHLTLPTSGEYLSPARCFNYAIRRRDGSLVFRTETVRLANDILAALNGDTEVLHDHRGVTFPGQKSAA